MSLPLLVLVAHIPVVGIILYRRKMRTERILLVEHVLAALGKKFSEARVTIEAHAPGAHVRKMHAESNGVQVTYVWPTREDALGLPRVLSGVLTHHIEFNARTFASLVFEFAHKKEKDSVAREALLYRITLEGSPPLSLQGTIPRKILLESPHLACLDQVITVIGGET